MLTKHGAANLKNRAEPKSHKSRPNQIIEQWNFKLIF